MFKNLPEEIQNFLDKKSTFEEFESFMQISNQSLLKPDLKSEDYSKFIE